MSSSRTVLRTYPGTQEHEYRHFGLTYATDIPSLITIVPSESKPKIRTPTSIKPIAVAGFGWNFRLIPKFRMANR